MHIKNKPPVLVPKEYWPKLESLSKCALMDLVWDFATRIAGTQDNGEITKTIDEAIPIVVLYRK